MEAWKEGLAPVIAKTSRVLILGSLPGDRSLRMQQYYAHPRNHFWAILGAVFGCTLRSSYEEKIQFVLTHGLALWDVLRAANRKGSLDANITKAMPNEFGELLSAYPDIRIIALNGGTAAAHFRSVRRRDPGIFAGRECIELPSSSGIPGKNVLSIQEKIERWAAIKLRKDPSRDDDYFRTNCSRSR